MGSLASCSAAPSPVINPPLSILHVVMDNNYPPYVFQDDTGMLQGILIDQWKLWEERTGVKVEISALPWGEALQRMQAGEFDVIDTIFYTDDRAKLFDFTASYARIDVPIFFQSNISGIAGVNDLKGFRVAVKAGDANADYLANHGLTDLIYYSSYEDIVKAAARKEETIFVIDQPPANYFLYKYGIQDQFKHSDPLYSGEFHRAVQKGNTPVLNLVVNGFAAISPADYQAIDRHWLGTGEANAFQPLLPYLIIGAVSVLLIILLLVVFNRTLQVRVRQRTRALEQTAKALAESEHLLNRSQAIAHVGHWQWDTRTNQVTWSDEMRRIFGVDRETFAGDLDEIVDAAIHPADRERVLKSNERVLTKQQPETLEYRIVRPDGSIRHVWAQPGDSVCDEQGKIILLTGVVQDITERQRAESQREAALEALRESEEKFRAMIEQASEGFALVDEHGCILEWNRAKEHIWGLKREEVLGRPFYDVQFQVVVPERRTPERYEFLKAMTLDALRLGQSPLFNRVVEGELLRPDGQRVVIQQSVFLIKSSAGYRIGSMSLDITERKRVENEIKQLNQDLEQRVIERTHELAAANARLTELDQLKSKFVSDVSHELRTPIANLKLYIDLLSRGKPEKHTQYITVLHQQVRRVVALVDDILDLSRLDRRKEQRMMYQQVVSFNEVVEQVVLAHQPRAEASSLALTFEPVSDLPPVRGDANQLAQVVTNLVANALNYTTAGYVRVNTLTEDGEVCLCVADSGDGIPGDDLPHIFERFYRGRHVLKNDVPGTGLGLAIVKEIVELHQGRIKVESRPQHGSTFMVWLPTAQTDEAHGNDLVLHDEPPTPTPSRQRLF